MDIIINNVIIMIIAEKLKLPWESYIQRIESLPEQLTLEGFFIGKRENTMTSRVTTRKAVIAYIVAIFELWKELLDLNFSRNDK